MAGSLERALLFFKFSSQLVVILEGILGFVMLISAWEGRRHIGSSKQSHVQGQSSSKRREFRWPLHCLNADTAIFKTQIVQVCASCGLAVGGSIVANIPHKDENIASCRAMWKWTVSMFCINGLALYIFMLSKAKSTNRDFTMLNSPFLSVLASGLTFGTYCIFPIVASLAVYFSDGVFVSDGPVYGCVMHMNYIIPAVAASLDMFLSVGFFYVFYKPLKDMISVVNSAAHKLDSSGEQERKANLLMVVKRNFAASCCLLSITFSTLVLLAVENIVENREVFSICVVGAFPIACVIVSSVTLYCTSKAWKWIGFSDKDLHSTKVTADAVNASVDRTSVNTISP
jgi:hypothetical protein